MVNLLLLLLFMATQDYIKVISPQEPIQQIQPHFPDTPSKNIGRTDRPINQRTQVVNTYLDWVIANSNQIIPTPTWAWEWTIVEWYTFTKTGSYVFENTDSIKIPVSWTYILNVRVIIDDLFWDLWLTKCEVLKNDNYLMSEWKSTTTYYESITISSVINLKKWDNIKVQINADDETNDRTLNVSVSITKIS